ncbi:amino acid ABC transporter permease [Anaerorhabdus furcosa]|uniref:Polar amino acid transport system permease protein n=1 Tax=Anaerorhabdus furcosa TaxID=118967 RepID=A0A1T4KFN1_9FIRM|nr:amino acid ABC transporter permease [Anaerorhabdus furcosa]SJZ41258.1 polar amino acid transport system permease protein [Anaerorhabdus furcosa]
MTLSDMLTVENLTYLLNGAMMSLFIAICTFTFGTILGVIGAAMKISKSKLLQWIAKIYVDFIRGTPMLLQILFLYLGFPLIYKMVTGSFIRVNPYVIGIIAISINSGAYVTELIRGGIQSIDKGQWEACQTLGLPYGLTMRKIILPQAFKNVLPPLVSEFIMLIKDSCLISCIGAVELLQGAQILGARYYNYVVFLVAASIIYLIMTSVVSFFANKLEKRLAAND